MADTAGQWRVLIDCYGRHRRPVARSNWLLWPTSQANGTLKLAAMADTSGRDELRRAPVPQGDGRLQPRPARRAVLGARCHLEGSGREVVAIRPGYQHHSALAEGGEYF